MRGRKISDYGYVVRGQVATYTVPISAVAGVANATCSSPCGGLQGEGNGQFDLLEFCKKHKCGCLLAGAVLAYLLLGR